VAALAAGVRDHRDLRPPLRAVGDRVLQQAGVLLVVARVEPRRADHDPALGRRRGAHHHRHPAGPVLHLQHRSPGGIGVEPQRETGGTGDRLLGRAAHDAPRPVEQQLVLLSALPRVRALGAHLERLEFDGQAVAQEVERRAVLLVEDQQVGGRPLRRLEDLADPALVAGRVEADDHAVEGRGDLVETVERALREALEPPALPVAPQEARYVVRGAVQHLRLALHKCDGEAGRV
jgi:hypothetical protein